MDYKWTIKDLRKRERQLNRLAKNEQDNLKRNDILTDLESCKSVIALLESNGIKQRFESMPISDIIRDEYDELCDFNFLWSDLIKYAHNAGTIGIINPGLNKHDLTKDDIVGIAHDFYHEMTNSFFYEQFLKSFQNRNDHLRFCNYGTYAGQTIFIRTLDETFIESQNNKDIFDIATLIHEYGHCVHFHTNSLQQIHNNVLPFHELASKFFELLSYDYLLKKGWDSNQVKKALLYSTSLDLDDFMIFAQECEIIKIALKYHHEIKSIKSFKKIVSQETMIPIASIGSTIESRSSEILPYITASMINLELLNIYHQDPEKALDILKNILEFDTMDAYLLYKKIKSLGIKPLENSKEYYRELKRTLK